MDAFVGKHLFEHALTGEIAKGRTRILVTHHLDLVLPATRHLILLGEGTVKFSGSPESFKKTGELQKIRSNTERGGQRGHGEGLARSASHEDDNALQKVPSTGSRRSQRQDGGPGHAAASFSLTRSDTGKAKKFIEAETKEKGVIKRATWIEYISSSGGKSSFSRRNDAGTPRALLMLLRSASVGSDHDSFPRPPIYGYRKELFHHIVDTLIRIGHSRCKLAYPFQISDRHGSKSTSTWTIVLSWYLSRAELDSQHHRSTSLFFCIHKKYCCI